MSVLKVKAKNTKEFDEACSDGCVYGKVETSRPISFVYVDLGREGDYIAKFSDDKDTLYKIFFGCDVFFAENQEDLRNEIYCKVLLNETVIIYN